LRHRYTRRDIGERLDNRTNRPLELRAVFISLSLWGWLWGIWGMLLSIAIIVIVKVVSQRMAHLPSMAELLGMDSSCGERAVALAPVCVRMIEARAWLGLGAASQAFRYFFPFPG